MCARAGVCVWVGGWGGGGMLSQRGIALWKINVLLLLVDVFKSAVCLFIFLSGVLPSRNDVLV